MTSEPTQFDSFDSSADLLTQAVDDYRRLCLAGVSLDIKEFSARYPSVAPELEVTLEQLNEVYAPSLEKLSSPFTKAAVSNSAKNAKSANRSGETLGHYKLLRRLGEGAMGIVYEAEDLSLQKRVAIKITKISSLSELARLRFKQEATIVASLEHEHIVPVFAFEEQAGQSFYVMQLINGQSLNQLTQNPFGLLERLKTSLTPTNPPTTQTEPTATSSITYRPIDFADAVARIGLDLAKALHYAHTRGIEHLDVKPSNVLLDQQGKIWLTDFGLAEALHAQVAQRHWGLGTVGYMSPEMTGLAPFGRVGASDIYSLGATLYCLLSGKAPFSGTAKEYQEWLRRDELVPLQRLVPAVPRDLATIIHKALGKSPEQRYASASELAADLQRYLDRRPITAVRPKLHDIVRKAAYRNRQMLAIFAGIAFIAMASFTFITWRYYQRARLSEQSYSALVTDLFRHLDELGNLRENADPKAQYERLKSITDFLEQRDQQGTLTARERFLLAQFHYYAAKQLSSRLIQPEEIEHHLDRSAELFARHAIYSGDPIHRLDSARSYLSKAELNINEGSPKAIDSALLALQKVESLIADYPDDLRFKDALACYSRVVASAYLCEKDYAQAAEYLERAKRVSLDLQALDPKRWWFYAFNECQAEYSLAGIAMTQQDYEKVVSKCEVLYRRVDDVIAAMKEAGESNDSMSAFLLTIWSQRIEALYCLGRDEEVLAEINAWQEKYRAYAKVLPGTTQLKDASLLLLLTEIELTRTKPGAEQQLDELIAQYEAELPTDNQLRARFLLYHPRGTKAHYAESLRLVTDEASIGSMRAYACLTKLIALMSLQRLDEAQEMINGYREQMQSSGVFTFYRAALEAQRGERQIGRQEFEQLTSQVPVTNYEYRFAKAWLERLVTSDDTAAK